MKEFKNKLEEAVEKAGGLNACCLDLNSPKLQAKLLGNGIKTQKWLKEGYGGDMSYLERMLDGKINPGEAFPGAQSIITITFSNDWGSPQAEHPFPAPGEESLIGYISAYAKEQDYHKTGHEILTHLHDVLQEEYGQFQAVPAVDTKPVFERLLAVEGGLGILGPNDLLRTPDENVRVFIGSLICNKNFPEVIHYPQMPYPCTYCNNCTNNCPTGALTPGKPFNSLECISYLTIEKKGVLNEYEKSIMEDWLFGCDWCSIVCPPKDKIDTRIPVDLEWLLKSSAGEIRRLIKGTALEYAGVTKLRRNAVAILQGKNSFEAKELLKWSAENLNSQLILEQIEQRAKN